MNKKITYQMLILGYATVSIFAICEILDRHNELIRPRIQPETPVMYYSSDMINNTSSVMDSSIPPTTYYVPAVTEYIPDSILDSHENLQFENVAEVIPYTSIETTETVIETTESIEATESVEINKSLPIPEGETSFHLYMDYRALTDTASRQWELQQMAWTDSDGFRRIGDDYCVALGTVYGEIGDRFIITTDEGNTYTAIMSDAKGSDAVFYDDIHSWYHYAGNGCNVVEFVVQTEYLPSAVTISGSCGAVDYLSGNIVSIERI